MGSTPIVVLLPFFKRFASLAQCAEQRFIEAFITLLAVETFDEAVLLGRPVTANIRAGSTGIADGDLAAKAQDRPANPFRSRRAI